MPETSRIGRLEDRVTALEAVVQGLAPDLESDLAHHQQPVDLVREYVVDEKSRVRLQRLIGSATQRALATMTSGGLLDPGTPFSDDELRRRTDGLLSAARELAPLLAEGCFWGDGWTAPVWRTAIERLANEGESGNGIVVWLRLRLLPAMASMYSGGISAVASERYEHLASVLGAKVREPSRTRPASVALVPGNVLEHAAGVRLPGMERHYTPVSDFLFKEIRPWLEDVIPDAYSYEQAFDRFEFLLGLAYASEKDTEWGPVGRFGWRRQHHPADDVVQEVRSEFELRGANWGPLRAGMFGGDLDRVKKGFEAYMTSVDDAGRRWF